MIRTVFLLSITILAHVRSAPFYTRSFVQTPTSRVSQYLIMPNKNSAYRVPMSQVHHYSDFQFPKQQQLVYYHPDGQNQYSLHQMNQNDPMMEQIMGEMNKIKEESMTSENKESKIAVDDTMKMLLDEQESLQMNLMEKLKRDDGIMSEMMVALREASTTTEKPELLSEPIVVANESGDDDDDELIKRLQMNVRRVKVLLESIEKSKEISSDPEVISILKQIIENNEKIQAETSSTVHPLMTQAIMLDTQTDENIEAINNLNEDVNNSEMIAEPVSSDNQENTNMSTMIKLDESNNDEMKIEENPDVQSNTMVRIAELISNIDQITTEDSAKIDEIETSTAAERISKMMMLELIEQIKGQPEIMMKLVDEVKDRLIEERAETSESPNVEIIKLQVEQVTSIVEEISTQSNNNLESSTESLRIESSSENLSELSSSSENLSEVSSSSENTINSQENASIEEIIESSSIVTRIDVNESEILSTTEQSSTTSEEARSDSSIQSSTEIKGEEISSTEALIIESSSAVESSTQLETLAETSTEALQTESEAAVIESSTQEAEIPIELSQADSIRLETESTTEAAPLELTTQALPPCSQLLSRLLPESSDSTESPIQSSTEIKSEEISSTENLITSSETSSESENTSEQEPVERTNTVDTNTRQGRLNSPTLFLHNNRFYVVSGVPEFYANFDAYQNPRTPIFSLQELQPIRPIDKNVAVQRIEPFRIYVEDNGKEEKEEEENNSARTQNDNERQRQNEPLKLQSNNEGGDKQAESNDVINIQQSMEGTMRHVEQQQQKEVKEQEQDQRNKTGEEFKRDLSDDSSIAQASPDAIAIAGTRGLASSRPSATALTGNQGLSIANPRATSIAGNFNFDDEDDDRKMTLVKQRRMRKIRKY